MKTTKEIVHDNCIIDIKQKNGRTKAMIHFIDVNPETINDKWFSVSDVKQLQKQHVSDTQRLLSEIQKELEKRLVHSLNKDKTPLIIEFRKLQQSIITDVFNNFMVSELPSNSEHVQKPNVSDRK